MLWCSLSSLASMQRVRVELSINGGASFTDTVDACSEFVYYSPAEVTHLEPPAVECDGGKDPATTISCAMCVLLRWGVWVCGWYCAVTRVGVCIGADLSYGHNMSSVLAALREMRVREAYAIASAAIVARQDEHWCVWR